MGDRTWTRRGPEQWRRLIERYERGTATQARFCEREGIAVSTFQYWRRRLREDPASDAAPTGCGRLVAVRICTEAPEPPASALRLVLPSGIGIEVAAGFDAATLRRVVEVLGAGA